MIHSRKLYCNLLIYMTPKKAKILMTLAILCIVLFGSLFWIMTKAEQKTNEPVPTEQTIELSPLIKGVPQAGDL